MAVLEGAALAQAAAEAKAYLRVVGGQEDTLVERLVASGAALCEAFTGRWLMARAGAEVVTAAPGWRRLAAAPVRAILGVDALSATGVATALPADVFAIDIDGDGRGCAGCPARMPGWSARSGDRRALC